MHDLLAHRLEQRPAAGKSLVAAADHEGERAGSRAACAAGDRRVERRAADLFGERMRLAGAVDVDRRAIDQKRSGIDEAEQFVPDIEHVGAGRQHGDDAFGTAHRLCDRTSNRNAGFRRSVARRFRQVEAADRMPRLHQIGGHRPAHIAEPDKGDLRHVIPPRIETRPKPNSAPSSGAKTVAGDPSCRNATARQV
ncbi:hypothetical protein D9M70_494850 [compost metagenome]